MAEFNAFSIGIGADITVLQLELQRAKNLLVQFEAASKKALTIGELNYSNTQVANLKTSIASLNNEIGKTGRPVGDASQSLINFSRIAQDAPYGIMGIANNLNPMVESFQRLAATEGGTKKALMAMVSGLAGPAGIGVAIGVVSSLAVTFSKEISAFFKGPTAELEKFRVELKKVADDINKIIGQEQTKRTKGVLLAELIAGGNKTQQAEALKQLKDLYKESEDIKNAKLGQDRKYYENLVNLASTQASAVGQEKNNLNQLDLLYQKQIENNKKRDAELAKLDQGIGVGFFKAGKGAFQEKVAQQKEEVNKYYDVLGDNIKKGINKLELLTRAELSKITLTPTEDKKEGAKKTTKDPYTEATKDFERSLKAQDTLKSKSLLSEQEYFDNVYKIYDDYINKLAKIDTNKATNKLITLIPDVVKQNETIIKDGINKVLAGYKEEPMEEPKDTAIEDAKKQRVEYQKWYSNYLKGIQKTTEKNYDDKKKLTDQEKKDMEDLGMSISQNATGAIMGMWEAMQNGESVLDSIGNMLGSLVQQLIQAALQAAIFAGIMSLMTGGVGGGGLSFAGYFGKAFGMAEGGIVTGPTNALIGEGNESEAVMPLSKLNGMLNTTFNAGAMSGSAAGGANGQFVLRGQDLVLALGRSNSALTLRR